MTWIMIGFAYDVTVYSMGNTLAAHREIHSVSQRHPGIVIVHDRVLHPMFVAMWHRGGGSIDPVYVSRMAAYYGEAGARVASESVSGARPRIWESDDVADFPLVEEALQRALGAVTHSEGHARDLRTRWLGPVAALHHPAYADWLAAGALAGTSAPARADGRIQLTTVGHVNWNKLCHRVISLLAEDAELAARTHYTIVGPVWEGSSYGSDLAALIRSVPQVSAEMLGWLDDVELDALMADEGLTKTELAKRMKTSRAQLDRLLDPENQSVTLATLTRAAHAVGRQLRLELV